MKHLFTFLAVTTIAACGQRNEQISTPVPVSAPVLAVPPISPVPTLDAKVLIKCSAETNIVNRLSCFDEFAKTNGLVPSSIETTKSADGKWRTTTDMDPLTDKPVHLAMLDADEGKGRFGEDIGLVVRCKSGKTEAYINWNTFLGSDGLNVTSRIDKAPASSSYWGISTDHKSSFMPQQVATLKKFEGASSYVVNLTPYSESPITAIFNIAGADEAFKDIRRDCKW